MPPHHRPNIAATSNETPLDAARQGRVFREISRAPRVTLRGQVAGRTLSKLKRDTFVGNFLSVGSERANTRSDTLKFPSRPRRTILPALRRAVNFAVLDSQFCSLRDESKRSFKLLARLRRGATRHSECAPRKNPFAPFAVSRVQFLNACVFVASYLADLSEKDTERERDDGERTSIRKSAANEAGATVVR